MIAADHVYNAKCPTCRQWAFLTSAQTREQEDETRELWTTLPHLRERRLAPYLFVNSLVAGLRAVVGRGYGHLSGSGWSLALATSSQIFGRKCRFQPQRSQEDMFCQV